MPEYFASGFPSTVKKVYFMMKPLLYLCNENEVDHSYNDSSGGAAACQVQNLQMWFSTSESKNKFYLD